MTNPRVSIVTPTLNQGRFIEHTIRSIKNQTCTDFEHIIVDGGSTDETLDILRRHEGTYPMRWVSEPDRGMYDAVNKGMRQASGDILAYLNSDDLYFPWTIQVVVEAFRKHPDADAVFGDVLNVDDVTGQQRLLLFPPFNLDYIRRTAYLAQPAVFWRRSLYEAVGPFDETLRYVADCDYWMRAGSVHRFRKVHEFLAVERDHQFTLRESDRDAVARELTGVRERYVSLSGPDHSRSERRNSLIARFWFRALRGLLAVQLIVPRKVRRGPWARLLSQQRPRIRLSQLLIQLVPRVGRIATDRIVGSDRYWLDRIG